MGECDEQTTEKILDFFYEQVREPVPQSRDDAYQPRQERLWS